jgi:hypothetical protein
MKAWGALAVGGTVLLGAAVAAGESATWRPPEALVSRVEAQLTMPPRAHPLSEYHRVYWGERSATGERLLVAHFSHAKGGGVEILDHRDPNVVFDGGCGFIDLSYDVDAKRVISFACHGYA